MSKVNMLLMVGMRPSINFNNDSLLLKDNLSLKESADLIIFLKQLKAKCVFVFGIVRFIN